MAELTIYPVTRINGDAGLRAEVDREGNADARLMAFGYRGFEFLARGSHLDNLLRVVSRICGCDSVFHQVAAAKAAEDALGASIPEGARRLRELAMWGQLFERHAVSLTVHSLPDLLFPSSDPGLHNIISIHRVDEEVVRRLMVLKSLGTAVLRLAGGRTVHAVSVIPGGAAGDLDEGARRGLLQRLEEAKPLLLETGRLIKMLLRRNQEAVTILGSSQAPCIALAGARGVVLEGERVDALGADAGLLGSHAHAEFAAALSESNSPHAHVRIAELAGAEGARVGPLARLNVNRSYGTSMADEELEEVKEQWGFPLRHAMVGHVARILEMMHAWEKMAEILKAPPAGETRLELSPSAGQGVGVVEAPEGLLVYRLSLDENGLVTEMGVIAPLQFNLRALEKDLAESAKLVLGSAERGERAGNLLEMAVRAYAPCIPCGLH